MKVIPLAFNTLALKLDIVNSYSISNNIFQCWIYCIEHFFVCCISCAFFKQVKQTLYIWYILKVKFIYKSYIGIYQQEVMRIERPFLCCKGCCWCAEGCCDYPIYVKDSQGNPLGTVRMRYIILIRLLVFVVMFHQLFFINRMNGEMNGH